MEIRRESLVRPECWACGIYVPFVAVKRLTIPDSGRQYVDANICLACSHEIHKALIDEADEEIK